MKHAIFFKVLKAYKKHSISEINYRDFTNNVQENCNSSGELLLIFSSVMFLKHTALFGKDVRRRQC